MTNVLRVVLLLAFVGSAIDQPAPVIEHPLVDPDDVEAIRIMSLDAKTFDSRGHWIYSDPNREATWRRQMEILGWKR